MEGSLKWAEELKWGGSLEGAVKLKVDGSLERVGR